MMPPASAYSHVDLIGFAELALHEHAGKMWFTRAMLAIRELRKAFPLLTLREATDLCSEARRRMEEG